MSPLEFLGKLLLGSPDTVTIEKVAGPTVSPAGFHTPMQINETMSKYDEWGTLLPETIRQLLKNDFHITPDEVLMNKIFATQAVIINPYFDWDMFENVCLAFNNIEPDFIFIQGLSAQELCWGFICIKALQNKWEPTEDITKYINTVMEHDGFVWVPWVNFEDSSNKILVENVKSIWKTVDKFTEDQAIGIQIDRLAFIRDYIRSME